MFLIILFILIAVLSYPKKDNDLEVRMVFILCFSLLSIILSYRASDFPIYETFYNKIEPLQEVLRGNSDYFVNNSFEFEIGYKLLNSFFKTFSPYVEVLYIFSNLFILTILLNFFNNKSQNFYKLFLPYFTFVFITTQVGIIRQAIAISIFYFSIQYLVNRNLVKYWVATIVSCLFHSSAIILPPLYFVVKRAYSSKLLMFIFLIGMLIFLQIIPFSIMTLLEPISNYLFPKIGSKLTYYIWQLNQLDAPSKFNLGIFENTSVFFLLIWIRRDLVKKNLWDAFMNICFNLAMLYIFLYVYIFEFSNAIYRVNYYFIFFKFFIIVKYIETCETWEKRLTGHLLLIIYCTIMLTIRIRQGH